MTARAYASAIVCPACVPAYEEAYGAEHKWEPATLERDGARVGTYIPSPEGIGWHYQLCCTECGARLASEVRWSDGGPGRWL